VSAVRVGRVGRPHGLDGSFYVLDPWPGLLVVGASVEVGGEVREVERRAGTDVRPIVRLAGCEDRESAEAMRGADLLVDRAEAPALEEDEWWAEDLEGCRVHDGERDIGEVQRLLALPSCEVLEVRRDGDDGGDLLLVPLVGDAVRAVDVQARRIEVDLEFLGEAGGEA